MPIIKGSGSDEGMQTFFLKNSREIFEKLAVVFDFYEDFEDDLNDSSKGLYDWLLSQECYLSSYKREGTHMYVFLSPPTIYVLIRRTGNFEKLIQKLLDHFKYVKHGEPIR